MAPHKYKTPTVLNTLPVELQIEIFSYLSLDDHLSCAFACPILGSVIIGTPSFVRQRYTGLPSTHVLLKNDFWFMCTVKDGFVTRYGLIEPKKVFDPAEEAPKEIVSVWRGYEIDKIKRKYDEIKDSVQLKIEEHVKLEGDDMPKRLKQSVDVPKAPEKIDDVVVGENAYNTIKCCPYLASADISASPILDESVFLQTAIPEEYDPAHLPMCLIKETTKPEWDQAVEQEILFDYETQGEREELEAQTDAEFMEEHHWLSQSDITIRELLDSMVARSVSCIPWQELEKHSACEDPEEEASYSGEVLIQLGQAAYLRAIYRSMLMQKHTELIITGGKRDYRKLGLPDIMRRQYL